MTGPARTPAPLEFGISIDPTWADPAAAIRLAVAADSAGLDLLGVQDHPYNPAHLDTWTLLTTLAAHTSKIRLFPDVANPPLRPPAMLAKGAASLDVLSAGRVELGLGAGALWPAISAMDGPRRQPGEAIAATGEAIAVLRAMWSGQRAVTVDGRFDRLSGVHPGPQPAHPIGIWLGAPRPRMLALTGRSADGWLPSSSYLPPSRLPQAAAVIDAAATAAGRDPATIRRVDNVMGRIRAASAPAAGPIDGPAQAWTDTLTALAVDVGMTAFVFWPDTAELGVDRVRQVQVFTDQVAPAVSAALASTHRPTRTQGGQ